MKSMLPKGRTRLLTLLPLLLAAAACVSAPPIAATPSACSSLLPDEWNDGVAGAPLPDGVEALAVGDWMAFADAQTAQLDKANDRYRAATGIVARCEARDREAVKRSRPKFLGLF